MGIVSNLLSSRNKAKKSPKIEEGEQSEMSFLDHLEELRWHLVRSVIAIAFGGIFVFVYVKEIVDNIIIAPFSPDFPTNKYLVLINPSLHFEKLDVTNPRFIAISPYEQFLLAFTIAMFGGIVLVFPYLVWEIWRFIKPGLHDKEKNKLRGNVLVISFLFFIGLLFSYYVVAPFSVAFLSTFSLSDYAQNQWKIGEVVSLIIQLVLGGAVFFELPIVVYYLTKLGVVTPQFLRTYYRHAIVVLLIIAAIITPPDVISQILIFLPLLLLYQVSIWVSAVVVRNREKEEQAELKKMGIKKVD